MDSLSEVERILRESSLGIPFTVFKGNKMRPLNFETPHVFITLGGVPSDYLSASQDNSFLDFVLDFENKMIHSPYINIIPEHRARGIALKLNNAMEDVGRNFGFERIRAYSIINERLLRIMPRLGYTVFGSDQRGNYMEKKL